MNKSLVSDGLSERWPHLLSPAARRTISVVAILALLALAAPTVPVYAAGTINVNRNDDTAAASACTGSGDDCSLRGAIIFANAHPGTQINIPAGTYMLTIDGSDENADASGDLDVTSSGTVIQGSGAATTIIAGIPEIPNHPEISQDRVLDINPNGLADFEFTLNGITIQGGRAIGSGGSLRSGSAAGTNGTIKIENCAFIDNQVASEPNPVGGAISHAGGTLVVSGSTFDGNVAFGSGGAISYDSLGAGSLSIYNSTFTNNVSTNGNGGALRNSVTTSADAPATLIANTFTNNTAQGLSGMGGAIANESGSLTIDHSSFVNNQVTTSAGRGGAIGSFDGSGNNVTVGLSRFTGNSVTTAANGMSLYGGVGSTMVADNNWWGVNTGPGANEIAGTATAATWMQLRISASPSVIGIGQTSTVTASFLQNSAGMPLSPFDTYVLLGLPISWSNPVLGTISGAQATIQYDGTATAIFTASGAGTGHADATVDSGAATANITIDKADTTTTITSDTPDPSAVGRLVTVQYRVESNTPGAGMPTGSVIVSDGVQSCTSTVAAGMCSMTFSSAGNIALTATYVGDDRFASSVSTAEAHLVSPGALSDARLVPDPRDPSKRALLVSGTTGNDTIRLASAARGRITVVVSNVNLGTFNPTGLIMVYGQAGDDTISVNPGILQPRILYGNDGNDTIIDGFGVGLLIGGAGNDTLRSGANRDILIGGAGADTLIGGFGDDILMAGSTSYDEATSVNQVALSAISAEWSSLRLSYRARMNHLIGTTSGGLNGAYLLVPDQTVFNDRNTDTLTGGLGEDWFLLNQTGTGMLDRSDRRPTEIGTDL